MSGVIFVAHQSPDPQPGLYLTSLSTLSSTPVAKIFKANEKTTAPRKMWTKVSDVEVTPVLCDATRKTTNSTRRVPINVCDRLHG